ncbi:MAG: hypothetical protein ACPIOQ_27355 [Promethearchaeia archaeon]
MVIDQVATPFGAFGNHVSAPAYIAQQVNIIGRWKLNMMRTGRECPNFYVKIGGNEILMLGHIFEFRKTPPSLQEVAERDLIV